METQLKGESQIQYLMGRWNMTRPEAYHTMKVNNQDLSELPEATHRVVKNGTPMCGTEGTLEDVVKYVRFVEQDIDRSKEHSPYTIGHNS